MPLTSPSKEGAPAVLLVHGPQPRSKQVLWVEQVYAIRYLLPPKNALLVRRVKQEYSTIEATVRICKQIWTSSGSSIERICFITRPVIVSRSGGLRIGFTPRTRVLTTSRAHVACITATYPDTAIIRPAYHLKTRPGSCTETKVSRLLATISLGITERR